MFRFTPLQHLSSVRVGLSFPSTKARGAIPYTHTHTHTHTLPYTHNHTHTQSHTHTITLTHTHTHTHTPLQVSPGHQEDSCTGKKKALGLRGPAEPERECSSDQKVSTAREVGVHQGASSQLPCTTPHPHPRPRAGSSTCHGGRIYSRPSLRITCDREDA